MARARNIKPGLYKNEDLAECSIWARYLFPGLWMLADREGRLEDRPKRIKGELLPFDSQDVEPLLRELVTRGFILRYQIDGASYIQILKFKEHQTPHYTEKPSAIKPPPLQETRRHIAQENSGSDAGIKSGPLPPDSLIPDSLIPESREKALSGSPPDAPPPRDRLNGHRATAREILSFLNEKTGRRYEPVDANLEPIVARLRENFTPDDIRAVVALKCRQWRGDDKMAEYLRPATLFNRTKFANYHGELKS